MTFSDSGDLSNIELTPEEMLAISREISFKFAPDKGTKWVHDELFADHYPIKINAQFAEDEENAGPNSKVYSQNGFTFKELNDISQDISRRFAPNKGAVEPELFVLPVDPLHLYAYWETGESKAHAIPGSVHDKNLTLRIYWRPDANPEIKSSNVWFDLAADNPECRQKVRLPIDDTTYSATLGTLNPDNSIDALAHSNIIHVPSVPGKPAREPFRCNPANNPPVLDFPTILADSNEARFDAGNNSYDETGIDSVTQRNRAGKQKEGPHFDEHGWYIKLHFNHSPASIGATSEINAEFMALFNKKGINVELVPDRPLIEKSAYHGNNASGQGM